MYLGKGIFIWFDVLDSMRILQITFFLLFCVGEAVHAVPLEARRGRVIPLELLQATWMELTFTALAHGI